MRDISAWLEELGLEQYSKVFIENDVDLDIVSELGESDLEKLGVSLGHRKKLLRGIAQLDKARGDSRTSLSHARPLSAEYRYLSVVFCDLVGSTALTIALGAEKMREINRAYQETCRAIIERYGGYTARFMGDGIMMYFGFPVAQEDAAERAIHVGLDIVKSMESLNQRIARKTGVELSVRVGIASGRVIVDRIGAGESEESNAVGEAPNLAARMQGLAKPNSIVVDNDTRRLAGNMFEYRDIGQRELKGMPSLTQAWEVIGYSEVESRFAGGPMSTIVGRDEELSLLLSRWHQAVQGEGQVIVLSGEAGIGKSRIIEEFIEHISSQEYKSFRTYCSSYQTQNPMYPILERVRRQMNLLESDSDALRQEKLERVLIGEYGFSQELLGIFSSLMNLEIDGVYPSLETTATQQLLMLQEAFIAYLLDSAETGPVLMLLEDAHWVDPTTRNLVDALVRKTQDALMFMVISSRPEKCPDYKQSYVTRLSLNRLGKEQVNSLIGNIAKDRHFNEDTVCRIRDKCEGVPLFIEEITTMIIESGGGQIDVAKNETVNVPTTLQASLLARLDKLGTAKQVAQMASVIGDRFDTEILSVLSGYEVSTIESMLENLVEHEVLDRHSVNNTMQYEFRHALLRDAAYSSLLSSSQNSLHTKIANHLSRKKGDFVRSNAGLIAYHFFHASDRDNAFKFWLLAGNNAFEAGATMEAVELFNSAKECIPSDKSNEILEHVYQLHLQRGHALNAAFGAASADAYQSFREAVEVSKVLQNIKLQITALDWEFGITFNAGMLKKSLIPVQTMKEIGERHDHLTATISGYQGMGMAHFAMGEFDLAEEALARGLRRGEGQDIGVNCYPSMSLNYLANTEYITGNTDSARKTCEAALTSAREESVHSITAALNNSCYTLVFLGEAESVRQYAGELIELSERKGQYMYKSRGLFFKYWAEAALNENSSCLQKMFDAISVLRASKEEIDLTCLLGLIAELQIASEKHDEAWTTLETAINLALKNHERFYLAELYRLSADVTALINPNDPQCLEYLDQAINTARAQNAISWERRACTAKQAYFNRNA